MSVVLRKIYVDGDTAKTVVTELVPSPVRCHLWASRVFPATGRTRGSGDGGGRIQGADIRGCRRGNQKPDMSDFWGKRTVDEMEPATQRGSYLEEAKQLGCRRL